MKSILILVVLILFFNVNCIGSLDSMQVNHKDSTTRVDISYYVLMPITYLAIEKRLTKKWTVNPIIGFSWLVSSITRDPRKELAAYFPAQAVLRINWYHSQLRRERLGKDVSYNAGNYVSFMTFRNISTDLYNTVVGNNVGLPFRNNHGFIICQYVIMRNFEKKKRWSYQVGIGGGIYYDRGTNPFEQNFMRPSVTLGIRYNLAQKWLVR